MWRRKVSSRLGHRNRRRNLCIPIRPRNAAAVGGVGLPRWEPTCEIQKKQKCFQTNDCLFLWKIRPRYHLVTERLARCMYYTCYAWCRMLDRPQTDQGSAETSHRTCSTKALTDRAAFDIAKLNKDVLCKRFQDTLDANTQNATLTEDSTEKWDQFKNVVNETAISVLGPRQRIHQDWFDDNDEQITQLLQEKNNAFITWQNDHGSQAKRDQYKHLKKQAQRKLREMKDTWWDRKAEEVQMFADTHNSNKVSAPWRQSVDLQNQDPLHYNQQMDLCWLKIRKA